MSPLSSPLIHKPLPWDEPSSQKVRGDAYACFNGDDKLSKIVSLISVGGIECQDLPMSGDLQETSALKRAPYIRYLLACMTEPLGRVCLYNAANHEISGSPLYQNSAFSLFYTTLCYTLSDGLFLIVEVRCNWPLKTSLYDNKRLQATTQKAIDAAAKQALTFEAPQMDILTPEQIQTHLNTILNACKRYRTPSQHKEFEHAHATLIDRWESLYAAFKHSYDGEYSYQSALNFFRQTIQAQSRTLLPGMTENERELTQASLRMIDSQLQMFPPPPQRINRSLLSKAKRRRQTSTEGVDESSIFDRPIFIVSAPRAGSTLLFETLLQFQQIWSTGEENHALLENIHGLHPKDHNFESNRLDEHDVNETIAQSVKKAFITKLHNREQQYYQELSKDERPEQIRFLEKTPKNALRIPFLKTLFPDALFIYLHRDYKSNVSSLIDGWRSHKFFAYKNVPGFENRHWKFLLIPQWQNLHNRSIAHIAQQQWQQSNQIIQEDLSKLPDNCWLKIDYQDLIQNPNDIVRQFANFADLSWDDVIEERCANKLPVSQLTLTSPQANKWEKHRSFLKNETGVHLNS